MQSMVNIVSEFIRIRYLDLPCFSPFKRKKIPYIHIRLHRSCKRNYFMIRGTKKVSKALRHISSLQYWSVREVDVSAKIKFFSRFYVFNKTPDFLLRQPIESLARQYHWSRKQRPEVTFWTVRSITLSRPIN